MKPVRIITFAFISFTLLLTGCISGKPHLQSISELQTNEIILVGRIELIPPLEDDEQNLKTATSGRFKNRVHMMVSEKKFDLDDLPISAGNDSLFVEFGKDFYIRQNQSGTLFYSGSLVLMESAARSVAGARTIDVGQMKLPGGLTYKINPRHKAVYIGTVRYYRDDYNAITKIRLINDYDKVNSRFIRKFGKKIKLRRAGISQTKS